MAFTSIISVINNTKFTSKKQWEKLGVGMGAGKDYKTTFSLQKELFLSVSDEDCQI
jgi:hypothetical protein